jgi:DDE superfamily endonuclease
MWCIPPKQSAEFVSPMEDVLEVYHRPHDPKRPVVCPDETFPRLIGEAREPLPPAPGRVERDDRVHVRDGTASPFLAFEPLAGRRYVAVTGGRKRTAWALFVREPVEGRYRDAERVGPVMDQLDTRSPASLDETFPPAEAGRSADRLEIHRTPEHGSWPNMAEIECSALARDLPERLADGPTLERRVGAWQRRRNDATVTADWRFTTAAARIRLRKLYPTINA